MENITTTKVRVAIARVRILKRPLSEVVLRIALNITIKTMAIMASVIAFQNGEDIVIPATASIR